MPVKGANRHQKPDSGMQTLGSAANQKYKASTYPTYQQPLPIVICRAAERLELEVGCPDNFSLQYCQVCPDTLLSRELCPAFILSLVDSLPLLFR